MLPSSVCCTGKAIAATVRGHDGANDKPVLECHVNVLSERITELNDEMRERLSHIDKKIEILLQRCVQVSGHADPQESLAHQQDTQSRLQARAATCPAQTQEAVPQPGNPDLQLVEPPQGPPPGFQVEPGARRTVSLVSFSLSSAAMARLFRRRPAAFSQRVWSFLEDPHSSAAAWWFARLWDPFIVATIIVTALQTTQPPQIRGFAAAMVETVFDALFALELLLRYVASSGSCGFLRSPYNLIDAAAVVPPMALRAAATGFFTDFNSEASVLHAVLVCTVPILRVLKTLRRFQQFHLFVMLFRTILEALHVLLVTLFILVLTFSCILYLVEPNDNIGSIPRSMWLTIVTVSTVGYGDVTPKSSAGIFAVSILVLCSVLFMAMPIGIIGNAFTQIWADRDRILLMMRTRDRLVQWGYTAGDMATLFRHFDDKNDGILHIAEFRMLMDEMQIGMTDERIVELFDTIDKDKSGGIDVKEFVRSLFPSDYYKLYSSADKDEKEHGGDRQCSDDNVEARQWTGKHLHSPMQRRVTPEGPSDFEYPVLPCEIRG